MQSSSRLQPLSLSNALRQEEPWSSDSDSGITVDSQSPPTKTTPDSGVFCDSLSWSASSNLSEGHSLRQGQDDGGGGGFTMSGRDGAVKTGMPGRLGSTAEEIDRHQHQRHQQDYVYSRLRQNQEEEGRGEGKLYTSDSQQNIDPQLASYSCTPHSLPYAYKDPALLGVTSDYRGVASSDYNKGVVTDNDYRVGANDYVPNRLIKKPADQSNQLGQVTDSMATRYMRHVSPQEFKDRFAPRGDYLPGTNCDEGYGTDSRSHTTGSLSSPLSSSLSSLTTDSSSSLNGSQRGVSSGNNGCVRAQPVAGAGRLVVGKRGMLVKRRDLPPVERADSVTLEDRLRALTTIEEEDSANAAALNPSAATTTTTITTTNRRQMTVDMRWKDTDGGRSSGLGSRSESSSRTRSGSESGEEAGYPEGLYSVIRKQSDRQCEVVGSARRAGGDGQCSDRGESAASPTLHRAVPVRVEPEGAAYFPSKGTTARGSAARDGDVGGGHGDGDFYRRPAGNESPSEVRFKAGGGGVKLNPAGQFEIDYSYYMKSSVSESNDEVNTYSPTSTHPPFQDVFADFASSDRWAGMRDEQMHPDEDSRYPRQSDFHPSLPISSSSPRAAAGRPSEGRYAGNLKASCSAQDAANFGGEEVEEEEERIYMNIGSHDLRLREDSVMSSMPNLSMHTPVPSRRHSGDTGWADPFRHAQDGGTPSSPTLRHPYGLAPGDVPVVSGLRTGQGNRNSCDVASLYRQTELSQTFPPAQGVAADRMSLNLGDLPKIQEQLRATSEMLLSSGKRHQFASSSDIYRLFQGQRGQSASSFSQGRQPPHRHSFHQITSPNLNSLADVRSRVRANSINANRDRSANMASAGISGSGPVRADHNISVPDNYVSPRDCGQGSGALLDEREAMLRERLARGQHFSTDVIHGDEGEQLSTLV